MAKNQRSAVKEKSQKIKGPLRRQNGKKRSEVKEKLEKIEGP